MEVSFIIIDENELDCFIARKIIEHTNQHLAIEIFHDAQHALATIQENRNNTDQKKVILLDLQMPIMNGFQFVEEFEKIPQSIQKKYHINILSSTRNSRDISRIKAYNFVANILEKPLSKEKVLQVLANVEAR